MKTVQIYSYNELSEEAKEFAYQQWLNEDREFHFGQDYIKSIKKGLEHFGFKLLGWSIDYYCASNAYTKISEIDEEIEELTGEELKKHILEHFNTAWCKYSKKYVDTFAGNCPFTGVCTDENFLDKVKEFLANPKDINLRELMKECVQDSLNELEKEYEYTQTKEYFEEQDADEYEYFESGRKY
jgi:hypothetical protein